jgi:predicted TIM-barrel fold metal-dependent hydrolase
MLVQEYGVWNKVLFGTDYPFTTVDETMGGLRDLNRQVEGTGMPRLDETEIENLIFRDGFEILGIG